MDLPAVILYRQRIAGLFGIHFLPVCGNRKNDDHKADPNPLFHAGIVTCCSQPVG